METDQLRAKIKVLNETVWEGKVSEPALDQWLANFGEASSSSNQRYHALHILSQFMYFGITEVRELVHAMYRELFRYPVVERLRRDNDDTTDSDMLGVLYEILSNVVDEGRSSIGRDGAVEESVSG